MRWLDLLAVTMHGGSGTCTDAKDGAERTATSLSTSGKHFCPKYQHPGNSFCWRMGKSLQRALSPWHVSSKQLLQSQHFWTSQNIPALRWLLLLPYSSSKYQRHGQTLVYVLEPALLTSQSLFSNSCRTKYKYNRRETSLVEELSSTK